MREKSPKPQKVSKSVEEKRPIVEEVVVEKTEEEQILDEEQEKQKKLQERLQKMKLLFARRNDENSIAEYRKRYFERKSALVV